MNPKDLTIQLFMFLVLWPFAIGTTAGMLGALLLKPFRKLIYELEK